MCPCFGSHSTFATPQVGLTGFKCRCDYIFCGAHRLAEAHDCSFNYKQMERQRLAQNNPLIQAAKMERT